MLHPFRVHLLCFSFLLMNVQTFFQVHHLCLSCLWTEQKGFHWFHLKANLLRISHHVTFLEHIPFYSLHVASLSPGLPFYYSLDPFPHLFPATNSYSSPYTPPLHVYHRRAHEPATMHPNFLTALLSQLMRHLASIPSKLATCWSLWLYYFSPFFFNRNSFL